MRNPPLEDVSPDTKWWLFQPAMLVYQRVPSRSLIACPLKNDGWKLEDKPFLLGFGLFSGVMSVKLPGGL